MFLPLQLANCELPIWSIIGTKISIWFVQKKKDENNISPDFYFDSNQLNLDSNYYWGYNYFFLSYLKSTSSLIKWKSAVSYQ